MELQALQEAQLSADTIYLGMAGGGVGALVVPAAACFTDALMFLSRLPSALCYISISACYAPRTMHARRRLGSTHVPAEKRRSAMLQPNQAHACALHSKPPPAPVALTASTDNASLCHLANHATSAMCMCALAHRHSFIF